MSHPLRLNISTALGQHSAKTATEVAEELGEPVDRIRYQLRQLVNAGMVHVTRMQRRRGVVEQFYLVNDDEMVFDTEELQLASPDKKRRMAAAFLRVSFREALDALATGAMTARDDAAAVRTPLLLDEGGWDEFVEIHRDAFERVQKLKAKSAARIAAGEEAPISATSLLLCFENAIEPRVPNASGGLGFG